MSTKKEDKSTWAIGGMTIIIIGVGLGIVITSIISSKKEET